MWDIFINPVVTLLTWLYALLGNNVVLAIIFLTFVFRMLTYPLFARQQESTKKMQELQPELKKIQEKYKDDREKQSQAQMELYTKYGVNPLAGCLPLFIQFPIIIALYQAVIFALAATPDQLVDLSERLIVPGLDQLIPLQSVWLGMDLTQPPTPPLNPAYALVLPALVMASQWLSFRVTMARSKENQLKDDQPGAGVANQAAAMSRSMGTIMPVMFGVFALSFSVGISIYFITSSVVSVIQYYPPFKRVLDRIFRVSSADSKPDTIPLEAGKQQKGRGLGDTGGKPGNKTGGNKASRGKAGR